MPRVSDGNNLAGGSNNLTGRRIFPDLLSPGITDTYAYEGIVLIQIDSNYPDSVIRNPEFAAFHVTQEAKKGSS